jgi:hypothetical protein
MLLCSVKAFADLGEFTVEVSGDVALQTSHDVFLAEAFAGSADYVGAGPWVALHADQADGVEGSVGLSVAAAIEAVAVGLAAGGRDRTDTEPHWVL